MALPSVDKGRTVELTRDVYGGVDEAFLSLSFGFLVCKAQVLSTQQVVVRSKCWSGA